MRFFSYYTRMPEANVETIIENQVSSRAKESYKEILRISNMLHLTARDVETVSKAYSILIDLRLKKYNNSVAYALYWILLATKYKQPEYFADVMLNGAQFRYTDPITPLDDRAYESHTPLQGAMIALHKNRRLADEELKYFYGEKASSLQELCIEDIQIHNESLTFSARRQNEFGQVEMEKGASLSGFLFYDDIKRWEEIKHLSPGQFLHQQVELFDFIPTK